MDIEGKVAVVSGASGIGRAAVLALAERGAKVVADVEEDSGRQTIEMAGAKGGSAAFRHCDVTKTEDLSSTFDWTVEYFGRFDIEFNNAGISGEDLFADELGQWERIIDIDLTAVIDVTRLAVRKMRLVGNAGVIINTASLIGLWPMASAPFTLPPRQAWSTSRGRSRTWQRSPTFAGTRSALRSSTLRWHSASARRAWRSCARRRDPQA